MADVRYPLYLWWMTSFTKGLSVPTNDWNHWHFQTRICIEQAFKVLKGVWIILNKILIKPNRDCIAPLIFCCVLFYNLLIIKKLSNQIRPWKSLFSSPSYLEVKVPIKGTMVGDQCVKENLLNKVLTLISWDREQYFHRQFQLTFVKPFDDPSSKIHSCRDWHLQD
jgi:hypothetical protein